MNGKVEELMDPPPPWSAFRTVAFGYTIMNVVNDTHIYLRQIDVYNVCIHFLVININLFALKDKLFD